jgi:hypothetical protein
VSGKHEKPPVSAATFDAQYEHSQRMAAARPEAPIQEKVDAYIEARKEERDGQ